MDDSIVTNLFVDSFDPLHVRDRVLRVTPVLRVTTPQFVDECLKLITISAYITVNIREEVTKPQGHLCGPPEIPILLLRSLPHSPTFVFRALNGDGVI